MHNDVMNNIIFDNILDYVSKPRRLHKFVFFFILSLAVFCVLMPGIENDIEIPLK